MAEGNIYEGAKWNTVLTPRASSGKKGKMQVAYYCEMGTVAKIQKAGFPEVISRQHFDRFCTAAITVALQNVDTTKAEITKLTVAKADTTDPIAVAITKAYQNGKTKEQIAESMQKQKFTAEQISKYLPETEISF